eukprot:2206145-Prorocentrum_lima.AAC.1
MPVLTGAVDRVILTDPILKRVWHDKVTQSSLMNPQGMLEVMTFVRIMIGEVKVRAQEEEMELKMLPALASKEFV